MKKISDVGERIGFELKNHKLELIFPVFMKEKEANEEKSTKEKIKYFKLFRKYNHSSKEVKEEALYQSHNVRSEAYMLSLFEAYYLLLMDYMDLGLFVFTKRKTNQKKKGRLNWNRTINKSSLMISGESLIYNNPYYKNSNVLYTHPLTILYGIHLLEIEKATGIKMNLNSHYKNIIEENKKIINPKAALDNYKSSMYSDRQRKVFKILEAINSNSRHLDKTPTSGKLYYVDHINNLWEHMLKKVLDDEYDNFKQYFPKGNYHLKIEGDPYSKAGMRMIPDIIKEYKGKLYIIDAKNYLPHINNNTPATADINKQILYRYFLSKEFNEANKYSLQDIKNIFLLPNDLQGGIIKSIGQHRFTNVDSQMGRIVLYQVDFDGLVNAYLNNDKKIKAIILKALADG